jgi:nucleoside-diphosphate-sugar epimerase
MKVLVTGASGFLGGHVAERLAARGDRVRAMVRKTSKRDHLEKLRNVELFEGALEDPERAAAAVDGVDAVVHVAGLVKARDTDEFFAVNVGGTSNLVDPARRMKPRLKRFVFVSSLVACGPSVDGGPVPYDQEAPNNAYGRSKLAAEKVVLAAAADMPVVILRPGAIYGPRDGEIFELFQTVKRGLLPLVAGGEAKASWVYATDCADACIAAIDADVPSGSRYFVDDGGAAIPQKKLFEDIEKAIGRKALVRVNLPRGVIMGVARGVETFGRLLNRPVMFTPEKADMLLQHWVCSSEDTRRDLHWQPKVSWDEGVKLAVAWYRENGWL